MKILILFLLVSFVLGGIEARRSTSTKPVVLLGMCAVATFALSLARFV